MSGIETIMHPVLCQQVCRSCMVCFAIMQELDWRPCCSRGSKSDLSSAPNLLPSGELSPVLAWILVLGLAAGGVTLSAINFGRPITMLYSLGLFLGTIYSVPPFRLKRFAVTAFMIIATVRGFLLNFGVFTATRAALGAPFVWSPAIM